MTLTPKEASIIKELRAQEQLCVEKYTRYSNEACDGALKNLFSQLGRNEAKHIQTLDQIAAGTVPQMGGGGETVTVPTTPSTCPPQSKKQDAFLCGDALSMEKHVSGEYDTFIFEFADTGVRNVLNHIQKEEQQHGEYIWKYMSVNGMYN
ncbi:MAG: spore coat protein [Oscillospiraceae bacterium]|nr:spore coat protein [Oscillospiraceae bacterium]